MSGDNYVRAEVKFEVRTQKAVLVKLPTGEKEWVPRSVLHYQTDMKVDELKKGQDFEIILAEWFADKIGLQY